MAFFINTTKVIDNSSDIIPGKFTTRASLPPGAAGYLAYVSDLNEFVANTSVALQGGTDPTAADAGITWYKFITKPMSYKNEVLLAQGTIAGGFNNGGALYRIEQIYYSNDTMAIVAPYLPFTTASGGSHSTAGYAYYHRGGYVGTEKGTAKHDWATYTVVTLTDRPNCYGGYINCLEPGPVAQNTIGVVLNGTASCYITYSTDSWTTGGYNASGTGHGWATYSGNYGYNWDGTNDLYRLTWAGATWAPTTAGNPPNSTDYAKSLNSKWGKFYSSGGTSSSYMDRYTEASNSWASNVSGMALTWQDQSTLMGQDWGYYIGFYWSGTYYASGYQLHYPTETVTLNSYAALTSGASAASSCTGPIP